MMRVPVILMTSLALVACSKKSEPSGERVESAVAVADAAAETRATGQAREPGAPAQPSRPAVAPSAPMLAYSYEYGLSVPTQRIGALIQRHEATCTAAGPALCQVVGSTIAQQDGKRVYGELKIRAAPAWLRSFRERLRADAEQAGGRVIQADVASEDLSRQIVDTEATLRAKKTLRDRLEQLLASRPGKLTDLMELERELAQVQAEIDATQSTLVMMQARVAMSDLQIRYESPAAAAPSGVWSPVSRAVGGVAGNFAGALAIMIQVAALIAPWAIVGGLIFALVRWVRRRFPRPHRAAPTSG